MSAPLVIWDLSVGFDGDWPAADLDFVTADTDFTYLFEANEN
jgi:hypothetical protein